MRDPRDRTPLFAFHKGLSKRPPGTEAPTRKQPRSVGRRDLCYVSCPYRGEECVDNGAGSLVVGEENGAVICTMCNRESKISDTPFQGTNTSVNESKAYETYR